jgi:cytoskeletal protein CcmA (bactofilin family)
MVHGRKSAAGPEPAAHLCITHFIDGLKLDRNKVSTQRREERSTSTMRRFGQKRWLLALLAVGIVGLLATGSARAAEFEDGETYTLESGQIVEDDLYVAAETIYIDGTVQGDLVAAGSYIEVNGTVTGDAMLAGANLVINGEIQDDARLAGAGVELNGTVGDDLFASGGGGGFTFPADAGNQQNPFVQGVYLNEGSTIGGDVGVAGGRGVVDANIGGDLNVGMADVNLAATVDGDANIGGETINIQDGTQVAGVLTYTSEQQISIPEGVASEVRYQQPEREEPIDPAQAILGWLIRTVLVLIGFALLTWLLLRFAPRLLRTPANALTERPVASLLFGLLVAILFMFVPLASALLVFLMVLFGGWFPGVVLGLFLFGTLAIAWFLSPLVSGLWVGRGIARVAGRETDSMAMLLIGVLLVALLGMLPFVGWFVYLLSFLFAFGALILLVTGRTRGSSSTPESAAQAV